MVGDGGFQYRCLLHMEHNHMHWSSLQHQVVIRRALLVEKLGLLVAPWNMDQEQFHV